MVTSQCISNSNFSVYFGFAINKKLLGKAEKKQLIKSTEAIQRIRNMCFNITEPYFKKSAFIIIIKVCVNLIVFVRLYFAALFILIVL